MTEIDLLGTGSVSALIEETRGDVALLRQVQVRLGLRLGALEAMGRAQGFTAFGATSFSLVCELLGLSASEAYQYRDAARACAASPELSENVSSGAVSVPKAAILLPVFRRPELQKPGDDWVAAARQETTKDLADRVRRRKEEVRLEEPPTARTFFLSRDALRDLERARQLVGRSKGTPVTESETVETVLAHYVEQKDPEKKLERARKRADKGRKPQKCPKQGGRRRRFSEEAQRKTLEKAGGDQCVVDGCDCCDFLDNSHDEPRRHGGPHTAANADRYCKPHDRQRDAGEWKIVQGKDCRWMVDRRGVVVGKLRSPT